MKQEMEKYTKEDIEIWNYLFENQYKNLENKVCWEYMDCMNQLSSVLNSYKIPNFDHLNSKLKTATGWTVHVVPGLIEADLFFDHLRNKRFCASTWLRSRKELNYIEEPDMFHDIFGHIPLFMNQDYGAFAQKIGDLACKWKQDFIKIEQLQRLYWFTIEFGVISRQGKTKSYGAGIISSIKEATIVDEGKSVFIPYDIHKIIHQEYDIDTVQPRYFEIATFKQLYESLNELEVLFNNSAA